MEYQRGAHGARGAAPGADIHKELGVTSKASSKARTTKTTAAIKSIVAKSNGTVVKASAPKTPPALVARCKPGLGVPSSLANSVTVTVTSDFKVGDMVVYPGHGVGKISALSSSTIGGSEQHFFDILFGDESGNKGMKIKVPVIQAQAVGLRRVVDKKAVDKVYRILKDRKCKVDTQTWNRRFREYSQKIKTGSVFEIAEVLRDLSVLSVDKELSFGEKRMLDTAQSLLVSEIAVAKARTHEKVMGEIQALFA